MDFGLTCLIVSTRAEAKSCGHACEQVKQEMNKIRKHVFDVVQQLALWPHNKKDLGLNPPLSQYLSVWI